MGEKQAKTKKKSRRGRPITHGGYSVITQGDKRRYLRRYLTEVREGLVTDLGPTEDELTTAQRVLIDRIVSKLGLVRSIESHVAVNGIFNGDDLAPCLQRSYLAYTNGLRRDLVALGIDKRATREVVRMTAKDFVEMVDGKARKRRNE